MKLLANPQLLKTGPVDHADWNYRPFLGTIQRSRFRLALRLLENRRFNRLLEIGYGSGVFLPELAFHSNELYGVDVHPMAEPVSKVLAGVNVEAKLYTASATRLPFPDGFIDGMVAISSLEFVEGLEPACTEIARVLTPDGWLVVITPGHSPVVDLGLRLLTGESPKADYGGRREQLIPVVLRHFTVAREVRMPWLVSSVVCLYRGLRLIKRG